MRSRQFVLVALCLVLSIFTSITTLTQEVPDQIQLALDDLSAQVGTEITLDDLDAYTFAGQQFSDASLGCPQPDQSYAQVVTPGFQFMLTYNGVTYDYRVSEDGTTVIQCSVSDTQPVATPTTQPAATPQPQQPMEDGPIVAVAPLAGETGTTVTVIANGFPRSRNVVVGIGPVDSEYDVVLTTRTDNQGVVMTQLTIPDYFDSGDRVVVVVATEDNVVDAISRIFNVGSGDEIGMGNPQATLSTNSAAPGTDIQLTATGFPPNSTVLIGFGPANAADFTYSLQATTDAQGTATVELAVPEDAQVGRPYFALVELESDRDFEAFSGAVIPAGTAPTEPPEGAQFTTADIFLIAPGDAGQSGILVGCNDSAIPVQVTFEPTVAPLTAALEQLFTIDTRMYGQSGLYNALYQSDLMVQGIDIDDSTATINLTGSFQVGGTCDVPRFIEQIRQTALQFSTIDTVNIFINGQPIEEALGSR